MTGLPQMGFVLVGYFSSVVVVFTHEPMPRGARALAWACLVSCWGMLWVVTPGVLR